MGVTITSVFPARFDTPMIAGLKVPKISPKINVEKVAKTVLNGIVKNKAVIYIPKSHRLIGVINILFPRFMDWTYRKLRLEGEWKKPG